MKGGDCTVASRWRTMQAMRAVKWIAATIGVVVAVVVVGLGLSIVIAGVAGGGTLDRVSNETIPGTTGPPVRAVVAEPPGRGPYPAVILIHEFWGLNDDIAEKAEALAAQGYVVVAPDLFRGSSTDYIPRAIFQVITTGQQQLVTDMDAVYSWLSEQPNVAADRIAVGGFCFGGRTSLLYALTNPQVAATMVFYGSPVTDPTQLAALTGPVLGIFGGDDASIPLSEVTAFTAALAQAGVPAEVTVYPDQPHAFVSDMATVAEGGAAGDAWNQMLRFLDRTLRSPRAETLPASLTSAPRLVSLPHGVEYIASLAWLHATAHDH